ncbi:MAG: polysaccharide biosynthesis protein [Phycisphaerales bacterium]|nr:polysaccharide biosynthesis protein [Phycisphaerales bacterium]
MAERSIIVGTLQACSLVIRQLSALETPPTMVGVVLVDESSESNIESIPVLGREDELIGVCANHEISNAIVTLPASHRSMWREISISLHRAGVVERFVPPMDELLSCAPSVSSSPTVAVGSPRIDLAKLVGRKAHSIDRELVGETLTNKTVLVTGAGGSIGSELVRQVATFSPRKVVLMERAENALFEVDRQLKESFPLIERVAVLHDVVDASRTLSLLERYQPEVVIHAAAHKHVPLMEDHPSHAVTNNVFGTKSIADASVAIGVERFVLISSDKAVNPVNVMGATKRLAEMYVQSLAKMSGISTKLSMVRFGNVLGSACSVLPIWADQIAAGRPVTVTDERMTRYFMTIPEAATLVLQAGAMSGMETSSSGEVFVLDMSEPINIFGLAKRFIRACGYEAVVGQPMGVSSSPRSVPVILTGARPGEKLHEQLSYDAEGLERTAHPGIYSLDDGTDVEPETIEAMISGMDNARSSHSRKAVLEEIARYIPTMNSSLSQKIVAA